MTTTLQNVVVPVPLTFICVNCGKQGSVEISSPCGCEEKICEKCYEDWKSNETEIVCKKCGKEWIKTKKCYVKYFRVIISGIALSIIGVMWGLFAVFR